MATERMGDGGPAPICEAFARLVDLMIVQGAPMPITKHEGAYECVIDANWKATFNGHPTEQKHGHITIPAFTAVIDYNGWPAGLMNPYGGVIAAGECANETTFIAAVNAQIDRLAARSQP
jgi:hypothetical protein